MQDAVFKSAFSNGNSIAGDLDEVLTALGELSDELTNNNRYLTLSVIMAGLYFPPKGGSYQPVMNCCF